MDFNEAVFVISGASRGIGKTLSEILASYNAKVIGLYHHHKIKSDKIDYIKCDITKESDIKKLFNYIKNTYGKIDVLVNCAAYYSDEELLSIDPKSFLKVLEVNVVGTYSMCKYAALMMDKGTIINMSSLDGINTYNKYNLDYSASKAAINNMTLNLAKNLPNIKVCALAPGWVDTDSTLSIDKEYIEKELKETGQEVLIKKEDIALKIIEMIINNDNYISGDIVLYEKGEFYGEN